MLRYVRSTLAFLPLTTSGHSTAQRLPDSLWGALDGQRVLRYADIPIKLVCGATVASAAGVRHYIVNRFAASDENKLAAITVLSGHLPISDNQAFGAPVTIGFGCLLRRQPRTELLVSRPAIVRVDRRG